MLRIPYGKDLLVSAPLLSTADYGSWLTSTPTLAAGDVTVEHPGLIPTNCSFKTRSFTSAGTYVLKPGDTITGATSGATAVVIGYMITSGTFAGGDAAGTMVVRSDSGTFQAENINVGSNSNVLTIAGALGSSGVPAFVNGKILFGVPGSQLLGTQGTINIKDATATEEWADTGFDFITTDHPLAGDPAGCLYAGTAQSVTGSTVVAQASADGVANPLTADAALGENLVLLIESASVGAGQAVPVASFTYATLTFALKFAFPLTPTGTIGYKLYAQPRAPAHVMSKLSTVPLSTQEAVDVQTAAEASRDEMLGDYTIESTGTTTTNLVVKSGLPALATNSLKGGIVKFKKDCPTAALRGTSARILSNSTTAIVLVTADALPATPAEDDTFWVL